MTARAILRAIGIYVLIFSGLAVVAFLLGLLGAFIEAVFP